MKRPVSLLASLALALGVAGCSAAAAGKTEVAGVCSSKMGSETKCACFADTLEKSLTPEEFGQVATAMQAAAPGRAELVALSRADCELTDRERIRAVILATDCDLVVNTAAFTQVDPAEAAPDSAFAVNAQAPGVMAAAWVGDWLHTIWPFNLF